MTPERWQRMNEIFHAALACEAHEREAYLAIACAGDSDLLAEIESLLDAHAQPKNLIDAPVYEAAAELVAQAPTRSLIGTQFGAYRVLDQLGAGGMSVVYLAEDTRLGRQVALKLLPAEFTSDPDRLRRFEREARATSALNHPNIITIYEIGEVEGLHFIATEFVAGQTLRQRMAEGRMELRDVLEVTTQVASALAAAHSAGVIHRDIKPENLMLRPDGLVKVLDFGLAKLTQHRTPAGEAKTPAQESVRTSPGVVMGTFNYMSPEQARGLMVDARTDLFSLGVVMHELIIGQRPFDGETPSDVIAAILTSSPPPLQQYRADVPAELRRVVGKALRKDREERYQHGKELLADLQNLKQEWEFEAHRSGVRPAAGTLVGRRRGLLLALTGLLLAVAAIVLYRFAGTTGWRRLGSLAAPPRSVPVTTFEGRKDSPSFSPDGNQLVFTWDGGGDNIDIYVKPIGAGAPLRLTTDPAEERHPVWSPDGSYIAFTRLEENETGIFIIPASGGVERKVGRAELSTHGLAWAPDGKYLAIVDRLPQARNHIALLSIETLERRKLTSPPSSFGDNYPAFSPDGKWVAFVRTSNFVVRELYVVPVAGGEPRRLTNDQHDMDGLAWTADSREIIFSSNRGGSFSLWRVSLAGGSPEAVAATGKSVYSPAISRQGNRLAYDERFLDSNIWRLEVPEAKAASREHSPAKTKLIFSTRADHSPQFSPDGRRIVFISDRSGSEEVWVCESDGTNPQQLTFFDGSATGSPRWSPDGRQIAFDSQSRGNTDVFVIGAEGGKPRPLTTEATHDTTPSWSHDGRWIYFRSNRGSGYQIWKLPVAGGPAVQVTHQGGFEAFESPDGRLLYYTKMRGADGIWQVPVEGGPETPVAELATAGNWRYWAVANEGIYFVAKEANAPPSIKFFSFARRQVLPVAVLDREPLADLPGLSVSPDGRRLLFAQADQSVNDLMLIENFQ